MKIKKIKNKREKNKRFANKKVNFHLNFAGAVDEACWDGCAVFVVVVLVVLLVELLRLACAARPADCISCADLRLIGRACTARIAVAI